MEGDKVLKEEDETSERERDETSETQNSIGNLNIIENMQPSELNSSYSRSKESFNVSDKNNSELTDKCANGLKKENKSDGDNVNTENDMTTGPCRADEASGGSEEEFSKPCQPCLEDNKSIDSLLYCVECEDYLCEKCVEMHRVVKPSKTHKLLPKHALDNPGKELKINKKEECPYHINEFLEWFCISDDKLCCNVCKSTEHVKCESIIAISSVAKTTNMQNIGRKIAETQSKLNDVIEKRKVDMTNLDVDRNDSLQVLEKIKADTENTFLRLMESLIKENNMVEAIYKREKGSISNDIENYSRIIKGLETNLTLLGREGICTEFKFIQMKKVEQYLQSVKKTILDLPTAPLSTPIGYERDGKYDVYLGAFERFGYFDDSKRVYKCSKPSKICIIQDRETKATVFDICEAGNDRILITDWYNHCLKLFDTCKGVITGVVKTPDSPFGICKLEKEGKFAVTITKCRMVIFIEVTRQFTERIITGRSFETGENCRGIAYTNERLYVACGGKDEKEGPGHIKVFDMNGRVLITFVNNSPGHRIIGFPCKLVFFPDMNTLVVTDLGFLIQLDFAKDEMIGMKMLNAKMFSESMFPSLCFDLSGRALCSCSSTKSVYLLSKDYTRYESVVTGLQESPSAMSLDHSSLKLYVGLANSSDLLCFQLENMNWEKPPTFK